MKIIEEFSELVKPSARLTRHTTKLTGITKEDLIGVEKFPQIVEKFIQFIGEDCIFVSWGKKIIALFHDCALHGVECPSIEKKIELICKNLFSKRMKNYLNIRQVYNLQ